MSFHSNLDLIHLWCRGSPALFSCSLDKSWNISCVYPGRLCSRPSHNMSFGVGYRIQKGRSDTSVCLVVSPQTCSHIRQRWEHWQPSAGERATCGSMWEMGSNKVRDPADFNNNGNHLLHLQRGRKFMMSIYKVTKKFSIENKHM